MDQDALFLVLFAWIFRCKSRAIALRFWPFDSLKLCVRFHWDFCPTQEIDFLSKPKHETVAFCSIKCRFYPRPIMFSLIFLCSLRCLCTVGGGSGTSREPTYMCTHHRENTQTPPSPICTLKDVLSCQRKVLRPNVWFSPLFLIIFYLFKFFCLSHTPVFILFFVSNTQYRIFLSIPFFSFFFSLLTRGNCASLSISVHS